MSCTCGATCSLAHQLYVRIYLYRRDQLQANRPVSLLKVAMLAVTPPGWTLFNYLSNYLSYPYKYPLLVQRIIQRPHTQGSVRVHSQ